MTMNVNNYAHVNTVKPEKDIYSIYLPGIITKKPSLTALSIIFTNLWKRLIISLNMHDTKMSQAEMDSTGKVTLETYEKSLVVTNIK